MLQVEILLGCVYCRTLRVKGGGCAEHRERPPGEQVAAQPGVLHTRSSCLTLSTCRKRKEHDFEDVHERKDVVVCSTLTLAAPLVESRHD